MSRVWLITGGAAALAREISDRGGVAACSSFPVRGGAGRRKKMAVKASHCRVIYGTRMTRRMRI